MSSTADEETRVLCARVLQTVQPTTDATGAQQ
jgi:hypothetical protein